jgi:anthranilate synthase/aminodeoxychorismate synthase-like glutamine amidotransferase
MILLVDNHDSFTHNLAHAVRALGRGFDVVVTRNDDPALAADLARSDLEALLVSPGPKDPARTPPALRSIESAYGAVPILGICLGHQCLAHVLGATIERAAKPTHGKTSPVEHDGAGLFAGIENPMIVARYHSLCVAEGTLDPRLRVLARSDDRCVMAIGDDERAAYGVQFHPESFLTPQGPRLLRNFFDMARQWQNSKRSPTASTAARAS